MVWSSNPIMEWSDDGGTTWYKVSDHGRSPLQIGVNRIENSQRMSTGTMRRYVVAKKHTFTISWDNIPSAAVPLLANGQPGQWLEDFHDSHNGSFKMRLRAGSDQDKTITGLNGKILNVMITDFSKEVVKRTPTFDLLNIDMTLEEQ